jgi:hypothetical protein
VTGGVWRTSIKATPPGTVTMLYFVSDAVVYARVSPNFRLRGQTTIAANNSSSDTTDAAVNERRIIGHRYLLN